MSEEKTQRPEESHALHVVGRIFRLQEFSGLILHCPATSGPLRIEKYSGHDIENREKKNSDGNVVAKKESQEIDSKETSSLIWDWYLIPNSKAEVLVLVLVMFSVLKLGFLDCGYLEALKKYHDWDSFVVIL
ncbi:hypothetical protein EAE99_002867 [Botrytis elliptica]|nr:hypothetical protein EAE99_002867 [Botrytis elliptica]